MNKKLPMEILPMTTDDVGGVHEIESLSFAFPWPKDSLVRDIHSDYAHYFVAVGEGRIVGFYGMWILVDEGHITNIAVHPDYRRRGVAQQLMDHMEAYGREKELIGLTLEVRVSNEAAQELYIRNGFVTEGLRKEYYQDTKEDALVMWRLL